MWWEVAFGVLFAIILFSMYGLGRVHEALWWIRTIGKTNEQRRHLIVTHQVTTEWWAGHYAAEEYLMNELDRRDKTLIGRWFG